MPAFSEDLLSDLKEDLARDAEAERARLAAEKAARTAAEAEAARRADEAQRAEVEARIEAERRRRALAHDIRLARIEASPNPASDRPASSAPRTAPAPVTLDPLAPTPPARHGAGFYFVVMGLPMICLTAIAVVWLLRPQPAPPALPAPPPVRLTVGAEPVLPLVPEVEAAAEVEAPTVPVAAPVEPEPAAAPAERPTRAVTRRAERKPADKPEKADKPGRLFGGTSMNDIMDAD